ncbi:MAG: hypothetical protein QNJ12_06970 [Ilumatobacter sp.]|uniref:hypothetical protein n=1 Tax=Ilumatobacter sp. TaxID=1967498 RepID=UPI00263866BB|nr:hypothetical protein [Ilumatobacter sp.]MDJ0768518.1 hypothetical protein [Ilumatobacter sp.]
MEIVVELVDAVAGVVAAVVVVGRGAVVVVAVVAVVGTDWAATFSARDDVTASPPLHDAHATKPNEIHRLDISTP